MPPAKTQIEAARIQLEPAMVFFMVLLGLEPADLHPPLSSAFILVRREEMSSNVLLFASHHSQPSDAFKMVLIKRCEW